MKKNQIVKFTNKQGKEQLAISDGKYFYVISGGLLRWATVDIENPQATRVKPEIRKVYEEFLKAILEQQELIKKQREIESQIRERTIIIDNTENRLDKALGLMTKSEFGNKVLESLKLDKDEYSFWITDESFQIEREKAIVKWYSGAMAEEEYDRTYHIAIRTPEAKKEYDATIKRYGRHLPLKADYKAYLTLEDKDWLVLHETYSVKFDKPLSIDNCEKLMKKLRG